VLESAEMIRQFASTFSRWTCVAGLLAILAVGTIVSVPRAQADENRWGFGSGLIHIRNGQWYGVQPGIQW